MRGREGKHHRASSFAADVLHTGKAGPSYQSENKGLIHRPLPWSTDPDPSPLPTPPSAPPPPPIPRYRPPFGAFLGLR